MCTTTREIVVHIVDSPHQLLAIVRLSAYNQIDEAHYDGEPALTSTGSGDRRMPQGHDQTRCSFRIAQGAKSWTGFCDLTGASQ
jgi:hypothetical protein